MTWEAYSNYALHTQLPRLRHSTSNCWHHGNVNYVRTWWWWGSLSLSRIKIQNFCMISNRFAAVCCRAKTSPATNNNYMFIMCGEAAIEHKHTAHTHTHTCSHTHVYCTLVYRQTRMLWQTQTPGSLDRVVVEHVSARDHETTFINRNGANGKERRLNEIVHFQISIGFIPIKRSNITGHSICCVVESRIYLHAVQVNHNHCAAT